MILSRHAIVRAQQRGMLSILGYHVGETLPLHPLIREFLASLLRPRKCSVTLVSLRILFPSRSIAFLRRLSSLSCRRSNTLASRPRRRIASAKRLSASSRSSNSS